MIAEQNSSVVLLRGLSREKRHWDEFARSLAKTMQVKTLAFDFPGVGEFFGLVSPWTIEAITDHVQQQFNAESKAWIVAHSMGCLVALEWMKREPSRFHGAIFANVSIRGICSTFRRLRPLIFSDVVRFLLADRNSLQREERKFAITCNNVEKRTATLDLWLNIQRSSPVTIQTMWRQLWAAAFYQAHAPQHPVLILQSRKDRMVHPQCAELIAGHWNLPIRSHPWAGHDIFHDDPAWCVERITEWTTSLGRRSQNFE